MRTTTILCHTILPDLLKTARTVIDCGANRGEFSRWLSQHCAADIYAFEPDPRLFKELPVLPRVTYLPIALDGTPGEIALALGERKCSSAVFRENADQQTVAVKKTTLDEFCQSMGMQQVDFIKIDIEGAELSLLENTSESLLTNTVQITVEFHDFLRREDKPRIRGIIRRMEGLGFHCVRFSVFTWGDCLFLNKRFVRLSLLDRIRVQLAGRIVPGLLRFIRRNFKMPQGNHG